MIVESGPFPFDNGNFPILVDPSPAYHDLRFWENLREYACLARARVELLRDIGAAPPPFNSFQLLLGLETLPLRMRQQAANARTAAEFLNDHVAVSWVGFPVFADNEWTLVSSSGRDKLVVSLGWCVPVKRLSWSCVQESGNLVEFVLVVNGQVGAFGEELAHKPVEVLV